jgi:hypothetical protein
MSFRLGIARLASRAGCLALALGCAGAIAAAPAGADGGVGDWHWQDPALPSGAAFSVSPATSGSPSTFDASSSTAAIGSITAYHWKFGDGSSADSSTPTIAHTYATAGSYTATLTETDTVVTSFFGLHFTHERLTTPVSHALVVPAPAPPPVPVAAPPPPVHVSPSTPAAIGPRGNVWVWLTCPRTAQAGCHGTVTIQLAGGSSQRSHGRHVHAVASRCARGCRALGSATYQARAGQRIHIRVHMASFVRHLLARKHSLTLRLTVTSTAGRRITVGITTITLRARRRSSR